MENRWRSYRIICKWSIGAMVGMDIGAAIIADMKRHKILSFAQSVEIDFNLEKKDCVQCKLIASPSFTFDWESDTI